MESVPVPSQQTAAVAQLMLCPQCHEPVKPEYYFCPNCGKSLREPPLSVSIGTQAWIYFLSIILPCICYLGISYWPAFKYVRSNDPQAKQIGIIAIGLLLLSTIVTFWLAFVWINDVVQSSVSSVNSLGF